MQERNPGTEIVIVKRRVKIVSNIDRKDSRSYGTKMSALFLLRQVTGPVNNTLI